MFGLGSNTQLGIGIAVSLHNRFSGTANQINNQLKQLRQNSHYYLTSQARDYQNQMKNIALGAGALSYGMFNVVKEVADFDGKIQQAFVLGEGKIGKSKRQLEDTAIGLSKMLPQTATEIADAMTENIRAGVRTNIDVLTQYQAMLATATKENIEGPGGTAMILNQIMSSYGLSSSSLQDIKDVTNGLLTAANSSQASVRDIGEAMEYSAFRAKTLNISLKDQLGMIAKLSQHGIRGSAAGTAINNMLSYLAASTGDFVTPKQEKAWQYLGLNRKSMQGMADSGNIMGVINALSEATKNMSPTNKSSVLKTLFNMRGDRGVEGLFGSDLEGRTVGNFSAMVEQGQKNNIIAKQSEAMMQSLDNQIKLASNQFFETKKVFVDAVKPIFLLMLKVGTGILKVFTVILNNPIGKILGGIVFVMAPLLAIMAAFRATVLAATFALRGMAMSNAAGGFGGMMRGLWGGIGTLGVRGAGLNPSIVNGLRAGTMRYNSVGSIINSSNGRIVMGATNAAVYANATRGIGGLLGRIGGPLMTWLPRIGGVALRFLPWVGLGYGIYEMVKGIWFNSEEEKRKESAADPIEAMFFKHLDLMGIGQAGSADFYQQHGMTLTDYLKQPKQPLQQNITLNVNGNTVSTQTLMGLMENNMNNELNFEVPYE